MCLDVLHDFDDICFTMQHIADNIFSDASHYLSSIYATHLVFGYLVKRGESHNKRSVPPQPYWDDRAGLARTACGVVPG